MHAPTCCDRLASHASCGAAASTSYTPGVPAPGSSRSRSRRMQAAVWHSRAQLRASASLGRLLRAAVKLPPPRHRQRSHITRAQQQQQYQYDVVGLAQAMVDFGATVEDDFLESFHVEKGGRRCVKAERPKLLLVYLFKLCPCLQVTAAVPQNSSCKLVVVEASCLPGLSLTSTLLVEQDYHRARASKGLAAAGWRLQGMQPSLLRSFLPTLLCF